jgi:hypothetical protein
MRGGNWHKKDALETYLIGRAWKGRGTDKDRPDVPSPDEAKARLAPKPRDRVSAPWWREARP